VKAIYKGAGGTVVLPKMVFLDRADGGHLIVNPPRDVWEQSELSALDLAHWCFLVGAIGRAMIDVLPQLEGGCVNYFEAGNWALNDAAPPKGKKKRAPGYRRVHMHVFGRSPQARHPSWRWGEAPRLPDYQDRKRWAAGFAPLNPAECKAIVKRAAEILTKRYARSDTKANRPRRGAV
jgi:diadenosine tetraphosphate (Ap4A) HIT family hydrolase